MLDLEDQQQIVVQMGRMPQGEMSVAVRCPVGHPCVVACYPLQRRRQKVLPFPTLYWLTCPQLSRAMAHRERDGAIARLDRELLGDPVMLEQLRLDHARYIARRWAALSPGDQRYIAEHGLLDVFRNRGIGGMQSFASVKCLHLHVAHHLADRNIIGEYAMGRFGLALCGQSTTDH